MRVPSIVFDVLLFKEFEYKCQESRELDFKTKYFRDNVLLEPSTVKVACPILVRLDKQALRLSLQPDLAVTFGWLARQSRGKKLSGKCLCVNRFFWELK